LKVLVVWHSWHCGPNRPACTSFSAWQVPHTMDGFVELSGFLWHSEQPMFECAPLRGKRVRAA
jgi:hypothetical protein